MDNDKKKKPRKGRIIDNVPAYQDENKCERCDASPAADYKTEMLCVQCSADDVFEIYNERTD